MVLSLDCPLSLETIEDNLRSEFRQNVVEQGIRNPALFLHRWAYLSSQVPRLHGAALARVTIPDIQYLLAEIAYGECGFGNRDQIHCKLLSQVIGLAPIPGLTQIDPNEDADLIQCFETVVTDVCHMGQDEAIGFIVGLEAPAYDILALLKQALTQVGIPANTVAQSEYIVIHDAVEQEHQNSGHEAMEIVLANGCDLRQMERGGNHAIRFLTSMVGQRS